MFAQKKQIFFSVLVALFIVSGFLFFSARSFAANTSVSPENTPSTAFQEEAKENLGKSATSTPTAPKGDVAGDSCGWTEFGCLMKEMLYGILKLFAFLASVAATIFTYVIDTKTFREIMTNPVIYEIWKIVRDFFNIFFILVLLLAAFATIFQVDKYSVKSGVLKKVIFGALFINFSYPITLMIVDFGNVMMYTFVNDIFGQAKITDSILRVSGLADIFFPKGFNKEIDWDIYLISIICMFLFGISFLTLSTMMLIRLVALPILVMFSPIGFAASAFPGMGKFSSDWWNKLIQYVFYGPIAVFMILIAVKFLTVFGESNMKENIAGKLVAGNSSLIGSVVYFIIPIIFFWIAITSAESLSGKLAGGSFNLAKKARGWAKTGARAGWNSTRFPGAAKEWWSGGARIRGKSVVPYFNPKSTKARQSRRDENASVLAAKISGDSTVEARKKFEDKRIYERVEENKKKENNELERDLISGDAVKRKAAALALAERGDDGFASAGSLSKALEAVKGDLDKTSKILSKAGEGSLSMTAAEYETMMKSLEQNFTPAQAKKMEESTRRRMVKSGNAAALVDRHVSVNGGTRDDAYQSILGGLNLQDKLNQDVDSADPAFRAYVNNLKSTNPAQHAELMKRANDKQRSAWA